MARELIGRTGRRLRAARCRRSEASHPPAQGFCACARSPDAALAGWGARRRHPAHAAGPAPRDAKRIRAFFFVEARWRGADTFRHVR
jgi:hypothetical protein